MGAKKSPAAAPKAASKPKAAPKAAAVRTVTAPAGGVVVRLQAWPDKSEGGA